MNISKLLKGVIPPMMSPVDAKQNIDEQGVRNIVNRCIKLGVSGVFVLGTMGEGQSIIRPERKRLIEAAVDEAKGRIPVLAGVSAEGTRKVMENAEDALNAGADYIVSLTPYFFEAAEQQELTDFFTHLANNISKPLVLYNNPYMTRNTLALDTICKLSENPNIVGIKNSSSDFGFFMQLIRTFKDRSDFSVFSGDETTCDAALVMGADGVVPGIGTLIPDVFVELYETVERNDIEGAKLLQKKILAIMDGIYLDGYWAWVAGQKYALSMLGLCQEYITIDNRQLNDKEKARIKASLTEFGITGA